MPPKRANPTEHHPPSSSSEEEEENSSVVAESSSEEEQEQEPSLSKTLNLTPNPQSSNTENASESESESESEAEEEPSPVAPTPVKSSSKKSGGSDWKSGKKNGVVEKSENAKKNGDVEKVSHQLWSKEDEIALLEGIIEFKAKRVIDPTADIRAFRDFIKGRLHFDVELLQLKRKICCLKEKLLRNHFKNDEGMTFSKSHDQLVYDLSKRIWRAWLSKKTAGRSKNNNGGDKMDFEMERKPGAKKRVKFDRSFYGVANMEEFVMKMGLELLDDKEKTEMEEKWKKLQLEELKLFARKRELLKEESDLIMAVLED